MKVLVGEHAGFCFGVRRAVLKAFECAQKQMPCVTLGPLIHNPQEVERRSFPGSAGTDRYHPFPWRDAADLRAL